MRAAYSLGGWVSRLEAVRLDELRLTATADAFAARLASGDGGSSVASRRSRLRGRLADELPLSERPSERLQVEDQIVPESTESC